MAHGSYYPPQKRARKVRKATAVIATMTMIVIICIAAVYAFRWYLVYGTSRSWGKQWGGVIASVNNAVQIQTLNVIYKRVAVAFTGDEFVRYYTMPSAVLPAIHDRQNALTSARLKRQQQQQSEGKKRRREAVQN